MRESIDPLLNGQHTDPDDDIVDAEILDDDPSTRVGTSPRG